MRKISWLAAMAVLAGSGTYAHADSITDGTFDFTVARGSLTPTGSFVWDSTTSTWKSFTVDWDGVVFNFAPAFPDLAALQTSSGWCGAATSRVFPPCTPGSFALAGSPAISPTPPGGFTDTSAEANGTYTVKETTGVPEPATLGLLCLGLAGVGFARRKHKN